MNAAQRIVLTCAVVLSFASLVSAQITNPWTEPQAFEDGGTLNRIVSCEADIEGGPADGCNITVSVRLATGDDAGGCPPGESKYIISATITCPGEPVWNDPNVATECGGTAGPWAVFIEDCGGTDFSVFAHSSFGAIYEGEADCGSMSLSTSTTGS